MWWIGNQIHGSNVIKGNKDLNTESRMGVVVLLLYKDLVKIVRGVY